MRGPDPALGAPSYLTDPVCEGRFYINSDKAHDHGTTTTAPAWMYPTEGHRDIPGEDEAHKGGDVWVADAALEVMEREDWSGMLLTFGGIDKAGHMWGGLNDRPPYRGDASADVHMAAQARVADHQVGRIMRYLRSEGLLDETLVVLTTDHAQLHSRHFFGVNEPGRGNYNWYYGSDADEEYLDPSPGIQRLVRRTHRNIEMSMQDSAIRSWLVDRSRPAKRQAASVMATLGGVRATYYRTGTSYRLHWQAPRAEWTRAEWRWHQRHAQEIVDTMAAGYAADVVGLLADDTSYGVAGDHGGAQESVQRIPIVFAGAGVRPGTTPQAAMRSVDIMPTILTEMGIAKTRWTDGKSKRVP